MEVGCRTGMHDLPAAFESWFWKKLVLGYDQRSLALDNLCPKSPQWHCMSECENGIIANFGIESYIAIVPRSLTLMLLKEVSWARERLNFPDTEHGAVSSDMKMHD